MKDEIENYELEAETKDLTLYTDEEGYYRLFFKNSNGSETEITNMYVDLLPDLDFIQQRFEEDIPF